MTLVPEGSYRLEAQLAATASFKPVERPGKVLDAGQADIDVLPVTTEAEEELV